MEDQNTDLMEIEDAPIAPELMAEIEKKVKELKEKNPKVRVIFPMIVDGADYDDKDQYIAYFRQPSFPAFSKYLTASQKGNSAVAMRQLATDCFLDGDKELIDDESLFMFGLMGQFSQMIEMRNGRLVNLSKPRK